MHVIDRTIRYGASLVLEELVPDRLRYEIERLIPDVHPTVKPHYRWWDAEKRFMWTCPDSNYGWHYAIDDLGIYDTWDEAFDAGEEHWRQYHEGRWPGEN